MTCDKLSISLTQNPLRKTIRTTLSPLGKAKGRPRPPPVPKRSREFLLSRGSSNRRTVPGREHGSRHPPPLFDTFPRRSRFARRDLDVRRSPEAGRKRFSPLPPPRSRNIEIFAPTIEIFASRIDYVEPPPCVPPFVKSVKNKKAKSATHVRCFARSSRRLERPSRSVEGAGRRRKGSERPGCEAKGTRAKEGQPYVVAQHGTENICWNDVDVA